jgi:hypothetical protein
MSRPSRNGSARPGLRLKKACREGRTLGFVDESGLSEKCPVTHTWAPRGQTPVIQQSFTWKQMSAIAGLSWWRFYFRFFAGAIKSELDLPGFIENYVNN